MTLAQAARRWARDVSGRSIDEQNILSDLVEAARRGEFQFGQAECQDVEIWPPTMSFHDECISPPNYDPRLGQLIELSDREGRRVTSIGIERWLSTARRGRDAMVELATTVYVSLDGLRRWCDRHAKNYGLPVPRFLATTPVPDRASRPYSQKRLQDWFAGYLKEHEHKGAFPGRDENWAAAKAALGEGVPRDAVRRLRREMAPAGWKRGGRPKRGETKTGHD